MIHYSSYFNFNMGYKNKYLDIPQNSCQDVGSELSRSIPFRQTLGTIHSSGRGGGLGGLALVGRAGVLYSSDGVYIRPPRSTVYPRSTIN